MYRDFETTGRLHLVVARENGKVVGYHLSVVRTHPHYKTSLTAYTDVYFLSKECRKGFAGVRLFREVERTLKARGVEKMFTGTKKSLDMTRVFEYLGWTETERTFTKYIGG
jgi:L-amino acid N-acyltransferase YncA